MVILTKFIILEVTIISKFSGPLLTILLVYVYQANASLILRVNYANAIKDAFASLNELLDDF